MENQLVEQLIDEGGYPDYKSGGGSTIYDYDDEVFGHEAYKHLLDDLEPELKQETTKQPQKVPVQEGTLGAKVCEICYEHYDQTDFFQLKCNHSYCNCCTVHHIKQAINQNQKALTCMESGCQQKYNLKHLEVLQLDQELIEKFKQNDLDFKVAMSKNLKYCPTPDCDTVLKKPCCCKNKALCSTCTKSICFKCSRPWHEGTSCANEFDFLDFADKNKENYWPCPKCDTPCEKISGCNKMTCGRCKAFFCWVCKKQIKDSDPYKHFGSGEAAQRTRLSRLIEMINVVNPSGNTFNTPSGNGCNLHSDRNSNCDFLELLLILPVIFVCSPIFVLMGLSNSIWNGYTIEYENENRIPFMVFGLGIVNLLLLSGLVLVLTPFFSVYILLMFWKTIYLVAKNRWL